MTKIKWLIARKRWFNLLLFLISTCILFLTLSGAIPMVLGGTILFVGFLLVHLYVDFQLATWYSLYRESYDLGYAHGKNDTEFYMHQFNNLKELN